MPNFPNIIFGTFKLNLNSLPPNGIIFNHEICQEQHMSTVYPVGYKPNWLKRKKNKNERLKILSKNGLEGFSVDRLSNR